MLALLPCWLEAMVLGHLGMEAGCYVLEGSSFVAVENLDTMYMSGPSGNVWASS